MVFAALVLAGSILVALGAFTWLFSRAMAKPRPEHPPGRPLATRDGIWVASRGEQRIANWLSRQAIAYAYEPEVAGGLTPDFLLEDARVVIEYWGLASEPAYEARMLEKIERYEAHGYTVVSLFPAHLHEIEDVLERELAAFS